MKNADLDHILELETTKNEYQRLKIFSVILGFAFLLSLVNSQFYDDGHAEIFGENLSFGWVIFWSFAYLTFCVASMLFVKQKVTHKESLSHSYILINLILESLLPGILLFLFSNQIGSPIFLDSPIVFIYFLIIIVSSLHLNFRLSLLTGLIAGGSYAFMVYWVNTRFGQHEVHKILLPTSVYYSRGAILLIAGLCAGLVGILLKNKLVKSLETMLEKNELEGLFSQQVSKKVMQALVEEKSISKRLEATIVFLDIRNFSHFAQTKTPEEVILFQNKFFAPVIQIVNQYDGVVHQILGDGLMISFGAPGALNDHAKAAFNACKEILTFVASKPDVGYDHGELKIGLGAHAGMVITGNIGNESRKQFSISGTPIIIAARLEQLNKEYDSKFLVSKKFYDLIDQEHIKIKKHGHSKVKGIDEEIDVIEIIF